jgi:hypothetical protein
VEFTMCTLISGRYSGHTGAMMRGYPDDSRVIFRSYCCDDPLIPL